jgi:tetratricopeptide (TPR) repeat protein
MGIFDKLFKKNEIPDKINIGGKEYSVNTDALVYSNLGLDKYQKGDFAGAIDAYSKAIELQPQNQNLYTMRGTAYEDMGNDIYAEKDFKKSLEILPNDFLAAYRLGMVYSRKKDFENAVKWLKVSQANHPGVNLEHIGVGKNNILFIDKKVVCNNLGNFLTQLKRFEEGIKYLEESIKIDPNYPNPYVSLGLAYVQLGDVPKGIQYVEKASKLGYPQATAMLQMLKNM